MVLLRNSAQSSRSWFLLQKGHNFSLPPALFRFAWFTASMPGMVIPVAKLLLVLVADEGFFLPSLPLLSLRLSWVLLKACTPNTGSFADSAADTTKSARSLKLAILPFSFNFAARSRHLDWRCEGSFFAMVCRFVG